MHRRLTVRNRATLGCEPIVTSRRIGALDAARGDLTQALVAQPNSETAYVLLGEVALAQEKYDEARGFAEKAMNLDPKDPEAYNVAGLVNYFGGKLPEAARADKCIACEQCEPKCPQKIKITEWMPKVHEQFGK